jgi:hypothetical protein
VPHRRLLERTKDELEHASAAYSLKLFAGELSTEAVTDYVTVAELNANVPPTGDGENKHRSE